MLPEVNLFFTEDELVEKIITYSNLPQKEKNKAQLLMRTIVENKFDIQSTKWEICEVVDQIL